MATFKFIIGDKGKSYKVEKDQKDVPIMGKKIGETVQADFLGLGGYELLITGGSDKDGFAMRKDVESMAKKKLIVTKGVGFSAIKKIKKKKYKVRGYRKRKTVRGNTISPEVAQINCKVVKRGTKGLEDVFGAPKKEERAKEEGKQETKEEPAKKEEKKEGPKEPAKEEEVKK